MKGKGTEYVRISVVPQTACGLRITAISDIEASHGLRSNALWIETSVKNKYLLVIIQSYADALLHIFLGHRTDSLKDISSIVYRDFVINDESLLGHVAHAGPTPIILKYRVKKNEYLRLIVEWSISEENPQRVPVCSIPETVSKDLLAFTQESNEKRRVRLGKWDRLNASLKENRCFLQPVEYVVLDSKKLVYIVNSKVANTSIKCSMAEEYFDDDYSIHDALRDQGLSTYKLTEEQQRYYSFTFVRNPFSRLVSCYVSKYHTDRFIYKKDYGILDAYLEGYLKVDEGFPRFIDKIIEIPYRLMDRHFRLQHDLVFDEEGACRCSYIGKFEKMDEDFAIIRKEFGLCALPHYNTSQISNWMDYYTEDIAKKVYEKYRVDFEAFGYTEEYDRLLSYIKSKGSR